MIYHIVPDLQRLGFNDIEIQNVSRQNRIESVGNVILKPV
jgi:hypothetical protein